MLTLNSCFLFMIIFTAGWLLPSQPGRRLPWRISTADFWIPWGCLHCLHLRQVTAYSDDDDDNDSTCVLHDGGGGNVDDDNNNDDDYNEYDDDDDDYENGDDYVMMTWWRRRRHWWWMLCISHNHHVNLPVKHYNGIMVTYVTHT